VKPKSGERQLESFIDRYSPEVAALGRSVLTRFRQLVPPAIEMVYDNYNFLVVGFGPTERPSEAVFSIVFYPRGVSLCFLQGAKLPDPHGLLLGGGRQVRSIKLPDVTILDDPRIRALIATALRASPKPFDPAAPRQLVIRSISAKQRPRRLPTRAGGKKG
jgi:hypothetical protein